MERYEVHTHEHGRPIVKRGPCEGLPDWPRDKWTKISRRPLGLASAKKLADDQAIHAVVTPREAAGSVYDNGKAPSVPAGWLAATS